MLSLVQTSTIEHRRRSASFSRPSTVPLLSASACTRRHGTRSAITRNSKEEHAYGEARSPRSPDGGMCGLNRRKSPCRRNKPERPTRRWSKAPPQQTLRALVAVKRAGAKAKPERLHRPVSCPPLAKMAQGGGPAHSPGPPFRVSVFSPPTRILPAWPSFRRLRVRGRKHLGFCLRGCESRKQPRCLRSIARGPGGQARLRLLMNIWVDIESPTSSQSNQIHNCAVLT